MLLHPRMHGRALGALLLLLAIAAAAAWWYFAPRTLPGFVQGALPESPRANPALYKWRDDKGRVHVTDVPPQGRPYQVLRYDPKTNVLPPGVAPGQ